MSQQNLIADVLDVCATPIPGESLASALSFISDALSTEAQMSPAAFNPITTFNRAMDTLAGKIHHLSALERKALNMRIMSFNRLLALVRLDERFADQLEIENGYVIPTAVLIHAYAECPFFLDNHELMPDLDELARILDMKLLTLSSRLQ